MDVDAVLLDNGGVLTLPSPAVVAEVLTEVDLDVDPARVTRAHDVAVRAFDQHPEIAAARRGFAEAFVRELGADTGTVEVAASALDRGIVSDGHRMWLSARPGAHDGLRALAGTGVALAVVSNAFGTVEDDLRALELCQVGDGPGVEVGAILDSAVVGLEKPDPAVFALALDRLGGVPPDRAVHVGDSVTADVAGARAAGLRALHFDPSALCGDPGHDHLGSLGELAVRLR